jgi:subtilisin family serine protease
MKGILGFILCLFCWNYLQAQTTAIPRTFRFVDNVKKGDFASDQVIVKYKSSEQASPDFSVTKLLKERPSLRKFGLLRLTKALPLAAFHQATFNTNSLFSPTKKESTTASKNFSQIYRLHLQPKNELGLEVQKMEQLINEILQDPNVEYAEPVYRYQLLTGNGDQPFKPNDPLQPNQYYLEKIKAYDAWQMEQGNPEVVIGISDWGFALTHQDLSDNISYNTADPVNGVDDDKDGYVDNYAGWNLSDNNNDLGGHIHGTFVSGLSSAGTNNQKGIAGVGFNTRFMPVKVQGKGGFRGFESIVYLADRGCKVINLSWGRRGGPSAYEQEIINYAALKKDVVLVASAGNDGDQRYFYPASYDHVISVAASNENDQKWIGSNYNNRVDITAPGDQMYSTTETSYGSIGAGTSYAAPLVSGAAALLRSKFPQLSAGQVRDILVKTADNIDMINPNYSGGLGGGRLNVYRALKEGYDPVIDLVDKGWYVLPAKDTQKECYALWIQVQSASVPLNNLKVKLTSYSPYVEIVRDSVELGSFSSLQAKDNQRLPFQIRLSADTPADSVIFFRLTFSDPKVVHSESFSLIMKSSFQLLQNNMISLALANDGSFSTENEAIPVNKSLQGFRYKGQNMLAGAGLMLGVNSHQVSNNVREVNSVRHLQEKVSGFSVLQSLRPVQMANADVALSGSFSDTLQNPMRIGLEVQANPYTWKDGKYAILEYQIKNISGGTIDHLQAGMYANWDVQGSSNNQTDWDQDNRIGCVYNRQIDGLYAGLQLLTEQPLNYTGLDNTVQSPIQVFDGFTTAEKYQSLTGGVTYPQTSLQAADVAHVLAATLEGIQEGETRTVAFAFVVGESKADLLANAAAARSKFIEIKRSPIPVIKNIALCRDTPFVIRPDNGSRFRLYNQLPLQRPLDEGRMFQLSSNEKDSTFYITCVDSLFESNPAAFKVQPYRTKVTVNQTEFTLKSSEQMILEDKTEGTVWRKWEMGDGTIIRDSSMVKHTYKEWGEYTVSLLTLNMYGCEDTFSQRISVRESMLEIETKSVHSLLFYPNPTEGMIKVEVPNNLGISAARIASIQGRMESIAVFSTNEPSVYAINLAGRIAGLYQLQVEIGGKWISRNVLVK